MTKTILCITTVIALLWGAAGVQAADTLAYSFEEIVPPASGQPDGFFGLGATVTQEPTIGVTHLDNSMKIAVGAGGFVGARTETVIPAALNDPPGVTSVKFDMTIVDAYAGGFADLGITIFGHDLNPGGGITFGNQVQFGDTVSIATLGVGTHLNLEIALDNAVSYRPGASFNDIFGTGDDDLSVASAFQFFISKNADVPVTVYIDNVRLSVPEPATFGLLTMGAVVFGAFDRRRRRTTQL